MLIRGLGADASSGALTLKQAAAQVQDAITFGQLIAQQAPPGHAIFAALDDANEALTWINAQIPMFSDDGPALPTVTAKVTAITNEIYDAAATLQSTGATPTVYDTSGSGVPWGWIAAVGAGLAGVWWLFHGSEVLA